MAHRFEPAILRDYDVRGTVGRTLDAADARALGRSFATRVRRAGGRRVVVGRDGRHSSPSLEAALVEGLAESGVDVVRIGVGPTPMLYFAEATLEVDGGVQVTGSHNPKQDNGFKMVLGRRPFFADDIQDLARLAAAGDWEQGAGDVADASVDRAYADRLLAGHEGGTFRIGWDAGNGAAGPVVEQLTKLLPGEHHLLFTHIDGDFPNHHPDPSEAANLAHLARLVIDKRLDFGLAFDGDGDRIGAVDGAGRVIRGDQILSILAETLLRELPGATVIADVKTSDVLFERVAALGGRALMARTGHSPIKTLMRETGAPLAGELSGHIFFGHDWYGFDDALHAAVQLIRAVHLSGRSLTDLHDAMPARVATPDLRIPVDEERKKAVVAEVLARLREQGAAPVTVDGARVRTADGWWLLRASNTEAALTVRAEARDATGLERLLAAVDDQLARSGVTPPTR